MRSRILAVLVATLTSSLWLGLTGPLTAEAAPGGQHAVRLCLVQKDNPDRERSVRVPQRVVERLLSSTLSYEGSCAEYGGTEDLAEGHLTAYSQTVGDRPTAIGMVFGSETLHNLPHDPPNEDRWCYDKDGDGVEDPMTECAGGYERMMPLSREFTDRVDTPFTYVLSNWNPMGHVPPGIYDLPHFDVHFYLNDNAEREAIRPGPCPALVNCDDYELGKKLPPQRYRTSDHVDLDAIEPGMGTHLIDTTAPEFHGERFTHTWIYGSWDGHMSFYEPMVTHEWFSGLADGSIADSCVDIKLPQAWETSGWYPTQYCLRYRENRDELTVSLEGFVHRTAS